MCGRMVAASIKRLWRSRGVVDIPPGFLPRDNIAPTSPVLVIRAAGDDWTADMMRWGLVPSWWKDASKLPGQTFNARAETIAEKPTFRASFKRRRCLIPADGFFEWKAMGDSAKQPYYIHPRDPEAVFAFAGLWDLWETADGAILSTTIITTTPNALMEGIHNRMPVILAPQHFQEWLDPGNQNTVSLQRLLVPCDISQMVADPVRPVRGDGPDILRPVAILDDGRTMPISNSPHLGGTL